MNLGHTVSPSLSQAGNRVVTSDTTAGWFLWDTSTQTAIASGPDLAGITLHGDVFATRGASSSSPVEVRSASTGQVTANLGPHDDYVAWNIAEDGSYVWMIPKTGGLRVVSPTGATLLTVAGSYANASMYAAPSELRIAKGPMGNDRIETIAVPSGASSVSPAFLLPFQSWALDGEHFYTASGNTAHVYSKAGVDLATVQLPTLALLGGSGEYFWVFESTQFDIYKIGGGNTAAKKYAISGSTSVGLTKSLVAILGPTLRLVRLDALLTENTQPMPVSGTGWRFTADPSGTLWTVAGSEGGIHHHGTMEDPQASGALGCGRVLAVAGSSTGLAAIGTASGKLLIVDIASGAVQSVLPYLASRMTMSSDGSVLAAADYGNPPTVGGAKLTTFAVPTGAALHTWPGVNKVSMSLSGTRLAIPGPASTWRVADPNGAVLFDLIPSYAPTPVLSPSGENIASANQEPSVFNPSVTTGLFQGAIQVATVNAFPVVWLSDNRVLTYTYGADPILLYDAQGTQIAKPPLSTISGELDVVSSNSIYVRMENAIYDVTTGAVLWTGPLPTGGKGAAASGFVVFPYQTGVYAIAH